MFLCWRGESQQPRRSRPPDKNKTVGAQEGADLLEIHHLTMPDHPAASNTATAQPSKPLDNICAQNRN